MFKVEKIKRPLRFFHEYVHTHVPVHVQMYKKITHVPTYVKVCKYKHTKYAHTKAHMFMPRHIHAHTHAHMH